MTGADTGGSADHVAQLQLAADRARAAYEAAVDAARESIRRAEDAADIAAADLALARRRGGEPTVSLHQVVAEDGADPGIDRDPVSLRDVDDLFELSYSNYLVLNRTLLQSMPQSWQHRFTMLIEEFDASFALVKRAESFQVQAGVSREVGDLSDAELALAGVTREEHTAEADGDDEVHFYDRDCNELSRWDRVLVPGADPVPHYNRGRTRITPLTVLLPNVAFPDGTEDVWPAAVDEYQRSFGDCGPWNRNAVALAAAVAVLEPAIRADERRIVERGLSDALGAG